MSCLIVWIIWERSALPELMRLVRKYGVVPKDVYPETAVSENTRELRKYLTTKLRGFACELRTAAEAAHRGYLLSSIV